MAGNGDAQRLAAVDRALSDAAALPSTNNDLVARIDAAVSTCRALGQEARAIEGTSTIFADQIETMLHEFHDNISDRLTEMAKTIGRLGRGAGHRNTPPT